ncbi:MAG: tetratricopeptide repeat protein [Gemmatimonadota bacterium]|nr:MAG: tetratricopeptide repeat protein [Gemmatimonadota bacterium]
MRADTSSILLPALFWCLCAFPASVLAQRPGDLADRAYKSALIDSISYLVDSKYVLPAEAKRYAAELRARGASGSYDSSRTAVDFAEQVTADLVQITGDSHFSLRVRQPAEADETAAGSLYHPMRYARLQRREHAGFFKLDWIDGNVGYLDLRRFYPISESKELFDGAMRFFATADAIIIDLRENGGGAGESLPYLSSYFLEHPTQLTSYYSREDDFLTEFWTTEVVDGERRTDVPLFLLTSGTTFSAAEMFAYDMAVTGRATLVGDSTRGGAHSVDLYQIDQQFEIYIPTARAINPVTSSNWEGTGVVPDVLVPSESALDTAIVLASAAAREFAVLRETRIDLAARQMRLLLDRAEMLYGEGEQRAAEIALDSVFQLADAAGVLSEFFMDVLAYNYLSDTDAEILYAVSKKRIDFFPESAAAHAALGHAYSRHGENELAIECFEKVLELDPGNHNEAKMIERLRG